MGWFKKKRGEELEQDSGWTQQSSIEAPAPGEDFELPELPRMPEMPSLPRLAGLPKFSGELPNLPSISSSIPASEDSQTSRAFEIGPVVSPPPKQSFISQISRAEPVFVKIDKFKDAISSFKQVKQKVADIEAMLKEIQELKKKEDRELNQWENEIRSIKSRIANIDDSLFKKLDRKEDG